jgi:hypothetical protein
MSGPNRLLAGEATDFERELLGAWDRRQPSAEARAKVLALAGAGLGAAVLTTASVTAAKAASTSIAPKAVIGWSAALMKWMAVGLVGATATAGAVAYVRHATRAAAETGVSTPAAIATQPAQPTTASTVAIDPTRTIELGPDTTRGVRAKGPSPARSSTLDDEVSMIDQARRAVTSGDSTLALQVVSSYDAKYPGGSLSQESTEIRIEALLFQGNRPAAERLAAKFLASHPSSPYVHRIHALLGEPKVP